MTDIKLKVVPFKPPKKVPADAKPIVEVVEEIMADTRGGVRNPALEQQIMASINRVVRLTKTLATIAGVPE